MINAVTIGMDVFLLVTALVWLYRKQSTENRVLFVAGVTIKIVAGIAVGCVYFLYYNGAGDTITYWLDGKVIASKIISDPVGALAFYWDNIPSPHSSGLINDMPRSFFFSKISGLLALLTGGNYWMMATLLSIVSFVSAWYLFLKTSDRFPEARFAAATAFLFFPSAVFWSSGLIKEALGLASLFFLAGIFLSFSQYRKIRLWEWIMALVSLWIGWSLKYYWIGIFLPVVLSTTAAAFLKKIIPSTKAFEVPLAASIFVLMLFLATNIHPNFYPSRFLDVIWESNREFMNLTSPVNAIEYHDLQPAWISLLVNAPPALLAGWFRPFLWEAHDLLSFLAGVENLVLLIMFLVSLPAVTRVFHSKERLLVLSTLIYCSLLAIFLSLSTPNLGTLSRYKIGFTPFLVFMLLASGPIVPWLVKRKK